jgi:CheY-like chemotaxis protein
MGVGQRIVMNVERAPGIARSIKRGRGGRRHVCGSPRLPNTRTPAGSAPAKRGDAPGKPASETQPSSQTIFVADDNDDMREAVAGSLRAAGHRTMEARDGEELLELLRNAGDDPLLRPDVVVTDVRMPKLSGLGVLAALQRSASNIPVLLMTALEDNSVQTVALRLGAIGVLRKPFDLDDLLTAVLNAKAMFDKAHVQAASKSGVHDLRTDGARATYEGPLEKKTRI